MTLARSGLLALALLVLMGGFYGMAGPAKSTYLPMDGPCRIQLDHEEIAAGIRLARSWLIHNQNENGSFIRQRHRFTGATIQGQTPVLTAHATLALALANQRALDAPTTLAIDRALGFWDEHSQTLDGVQVPIWPEADAGQTSVAAMLALTHHLRAQQEAGQTEEQRAHHLAQRDGYLALLARAQNENGHIAQRFGTDGQFAVKAAHNPVADSTALAALVFTAHDRERAVALADRTWTDDFVRVQAARQHEEPIKTLVPWFPLTVHQMARDGWLDSAVAGSQLVRLSDWLVEHNQNRSRDTAAHARAGVVYAAAWASENQDPRAPALRCATDDALGHLLTLQVGHPTLGDAVGRPGNKTRRGGVRTRSGEPFMTVDATANLLIHLLAAIPLYRSADG